jgi:oxygen-independent coproporphyrinogen-3 oxidase
LGRFSQWIGESVKVEAGYPKAVHDPTVGLYVHVPFCERVCPYCDFAVTRTRVLDPQLEEAYVEALCQELRAREAVFSPRRLETVYLGGGTPSLLRPESLARILAAAQACFAQGASSEVTLEVNPSTLERARLSGFRQAGVNRLSVGVQSFNDLVLRRLGRAHRASEARATLAAARASGFTNLSLDLIFGAPGQREADFAHDLDEVIVFGPQHVSAYMLTIEPGTPFALAAKRGQLVLADDDSVATMMELAASRLASAGLPPYEISSFAQPGFESRHNRRYWERRPVLGIGVGAFSTEPPAPGTPFGARSENVRDLAEYLKRVSRGELPRVAAPEILDERTARGEAMFLALRTVAGLDATRFAQEFGAPPRRFFAAAIEACTRAGLLSERSGGDLCLTARGRLLSDSVFAQLV